MRTLQLTLFAIGVLSFLAAALFTGEGTGDTLWRAGVAVILIDLMCMKLWPVTGSS
jgi:hypothetical protein